MRPKPKTRTFTRDWLLANVKGDNPAGEAKVVSDEISDTTRWHVIHDLVFSFEGKHYSTCIYRAATEYQEDDFWDGETEVECVEVEQKPVTVMQWVEVPA